MSFLRIIKGFSRGQMPAFAGPVAVVGANTAAPIVASPPPPSAPPPPSPGPPPPPPPPPPGVGAYQAFQNQSPSADLGPSGGGSTAVAVAGFSGGLDAFISSVGHHTARGVGRAAGEAIGVAVGSFIAPEFPLAPEIGAITGGQLGEAAGDAFVRNFYRPGGFNPLALLETQPSPAQGFPALNPQPQPLEPASRPFRAPILDQTSDCPECTGGQRGLLQQQQRTLERDIQREQEQQIQKQIEQQQHEIQRLEQQEQRPLESRDIQRELQQKQDLLRTVEGELRPQSIPQPEFQPAPQPLGGPAPVPVLQPQPGPVPQPVPQTFIQKQPEPQPLESIQKPVKFCVYCTTQNEALKFLNGEPSECSVSPD